MQQRRHPQARRLNSSGWPSSTTTGRQRGGTTVIAAAGGGASQPKKLATVCTLLLVLLSVLAFVFVLDGGGRTAVLRPEELFLLQDLLTDDDGDRKESGDGDGDRNHRADNFAVAGENDRIRRDRSRKKIRGGNGDGDGVDGATEDDDSDGQEKNEQHQRQEPDVYDNGVDDSYVTELVRQFPDDCSGKEPMLGTLHAAKVHLGRALCKQLPLWSNVVELYGPEPVVLGMETCERYRTDNAREGTGPLPKLAGLWNTGSTALSQSFLTNFEPRYRRSWPIHRATVPWGKHTPLWLKYINTWPTSNSDPKDRVLPVVVVRDPFRWMNTMVAYRFLYA